MTATLAIASGECSEGRSRQDPIDVLVECPLVKPPRTNATVCAIMFAFLRATQSRRDKTLQSNRTEKVKSGSVTL